MTNEQQKEVSDAVLVEKTLENQYNFATLMERYEARLFRYIRRISNVGEQEAEDILQETFIKAYYNLRGFDLTGSFSAWIYRIAHNQTISTYRKKNVRPEGHVLDIEDDIISLIAADFDLGVDVDQKLLKQYLNELMREMDLKYREVIVLRYFQDKSYKEIAEIIQKPEGTVATLINRAKKQLREIIEATE